MSKRRAKAESEQFDTIRQYLRSPAARELLARIRDGDAAARKRLAAVGIRWPERPAIEDYERLAMLCGETLDFTRRGDFTLAHLVELAEARAASATWRARLAAAADAKATASDSRQSITEFKSADWLGIHKGIPRERLSELAASGKVETVKPPRGYTDHEGSRPRTLYHVSQAVRAYKPRVRKN